MPYLKFFPDSCSATGLNEPIQVSSQKGSIVVFVSGLFFVLAGGFVFCVIVLGDRVD